MLSSKHGFIVIMIFSKQTAILLASTLAVSASAQSSSATSSAFNPLASTNVAAYYASSPSTTTPNMFELCNEPNIDIVIIGFMLNFGTAALMPTYSFPDSCTTTLMKRQLATCADLTQNVSYCQQQGKKVFVSIGSPSGSINFNSSADAYTAANTLWNVFGEGNGSPSLRPFAGGPVDGFDFGE